MPQPANAKIHHIVHMDRLTSIAGDGFLWSDREILSRQIVGTTIGMSRIKERRLRLPVKCYPETTVGEYVPFYYCPRSIMLYLIQMRNLDVAFKGGQEPIVHLEFDLQKVLDWATANQRRWAIALSNAGAVYTEFRDGTAGFDELDWAAIANTDFRLSEVKERKQAEFLVYRAVPWMLVERIGVCKPSAQRQVHDLLSQFEHRPTVEVRPDWYY